MLEALELQAQKVARQFHHMHVDGLHKFIHFILENSVGETVLKFEVFDHFDQTENRNLIEGLLCLLECCAAYC